MAFAFVFPGQGSQSVGTLSALAQTEPVVKQTFDEASSVLGYDLWELAQQGPESEQASTERTQPLMLATGAPALIECGPGKVLSDLNRRIERNKGIAMLAIEDAARCPKP